MLLKENGDGEIVAFNVFYTFLSKQDIVFRVLGIEKDLNTEESTVRAIKDDADFFWTVGA